jgi:hypothetical protein
MRPLDRTAALPIIQREVARIEGLFDTPLGSWEDKVVPFVNRNRKLHKRFPDYVGIKQINVCFALGIDISDEDYQWLLDQFEPLRSRYEAHNARFTMRLTQFVLQHLMLHLYWDEVSSRLTMPKDHYMGLIHTGISGIWFRLDHSSFLEIEGYGFPLFYHPSQGDNDDLMA